MPVIFASQQRHMAHNATPTDMELKTKHIINREQKSITFLLYGIIGDKVDGDYLAQEINWADSYYDTIQLRINSDGGSVSQGLSILSVLMSAKAFVHIHVDGVAASMAAVLLPAADKVTMNDYARIMIHSPYYVDENGKAIENLSDKDKKSLAHTKAQLVTLLSKRGKTEEEVTKLMKTDTWFDASTALLEGLVDEVITTGRKKELAALEPKQLVACLIKESLPKTEIIMKQVCAKLGIAAESDEQAIVAAIEAREAAVVDQHIAFGKKTGVITDANEAKMRRLAAADFELFLDFVGEAQPGTATQKATGGQRVSSLLKDLNVKAPGAKAEKTYDWMQRNDPAALAKLEREDPEKFEALLDEYEANL